MKNKWKNQRLWVKLTFMVLITVALTVSVLYLLLTNRIYEATQTQEEEQLLSIAEIVAAQPLVIETLNDGATNPEVQAYADQITETYQLDFVVVMTMDRIRLTHPDPAKINEPFQGGDEEAALAGQETTSIAQGTLGQSLRAFVPVFAAENTEIGVVAIGIKTTTLASIAKKTMQPFSVSFAVSLLFGFAAAIFTAFQLKTQMYNLEPIEIARLLEERNAMLENTKDAILVTDKNNKIVLSNLEAKKLFHPLQADGTGGDSENLVGLPLQSLLPVAQDLQALGGPSKPTDRIYHLDGVDYLLSVAPITVSKKTVGQIVLMRDATELYLLTDQLFNAATYATTLQTQSHDFLNKLHVIYGLAELEEYAELNDYLGKILEPAQEFSHRMIFLVKNPVIAGFLIGERSKFTERNYPFMIEVYPDVPPTTDHMAVQCWINIIRFLNQFILENQLADDLQIHFGFWNERLETVYELQVEPAMQERLAKELHAPMISQLLKKVDGRLEIESNARRVRIFLKTAYREEKN
ncbi:Spo0B domain-containing protein [Trichococcus ilyis]|uniref:Signal transduction histidine kinase sporulation regulator spoob n=1 Tax=Trichococcus ilyis TaxID=640938 RepID=A0A143YU36_9LACT|nr:sensor histidine kinase [Trichococcus ilyis]CZQ98876.1 signal transduction histidine kinase sporulation regulator spoob [Trichococcus ilyis]SEJ12728.1 two-component system, CitB family, sensor kinase [Trichococcus ilyis]